MSRCSSADFLGSDSALLGRRLLICRDVELGMVVFDRVLISISKGSIRLQYGDCTFSSLLQLQYNVKRSYDMSLSSRSMPSRIDTDSIVS